MTLTVSQLESLKFTRDRNEVAPYPLLVGPPYNPVKAVLISNRVGILPDYWKEVMQCRFWVNGELSDPYYGFWRHLSVWEDYIYDNVTPEHYMWEARVSVKDRAVVMLLTPKDGNTVTLSFDVPCHGNQMSIAVRKDASSTEIEVTINGVQVFCTKNICL